VLTANPPTGCLPACCRRAFQPNGFEYAYWDDTSDGPFTVDPTHLLNNTDGNGLASTLHQLYGNHSDIGYAMWNDEVRTGRCLIF
jgi:hypothetical protein